MENIVLYNTEPFFFFLKYPPLSLVSALFLIRTICFNRRLINEHRMKMLAKEPIHKPTCKWEIYLVPWDFYICSDILYLHSADSFLPRYQMEGLKLLDD